MFPVYKGLIDNDLSNELGYPATFKVDFEKLNCTMAIDFSLDKPNAVLIYNTNITICLIMEKKMFSYPNSALILHLLS